jgi:hypothetical protein
MNEAGESSFGMWIKSGKTAVSFPTAQDAISCGSVRARAVLTGVSKEG